MVQTADSLNNRSFHIISELVTMSDHKVCLRVIQTNGITSVKE